MVVGRTIHTLDGVLLLSEGVVLTAEHITKLNQNRIRELFVEDGLAKGLVVEESVRHEVLVQVKSHVKQIMSLPSLKAGIDGRRVTELVERLLEQILASGDILHHLADIRSIDDYTFSHSVNVSIYSMIVGIGMGIKTEALRELGTGALLHDIGKLLVDNAILQKPGGLTPDEFEQVKMHADYGHDLMRKVKGVSPSAADIASGHHERIDGSGYPRGLSGNAIPLSARIVAVADVYDALTSDRIYRHREEHGKALDYIAAKAGTHFDRAVTDVFVRHMAHYPVGTAVVLHSGEKGLVARQNLSHPHRPVVRVVIDNEGRLLKQHHEVDLSTSGDNRIASIWEI